MDPLVSVDYLHRELENLVVLDATIAPPGQLLPDGPLTGIPTAVRFDIDGAFSRHDDADGPVGVHEMLSPHEFQAALRGIGLRSGDRVVTYDALGMFSSARAWWMLQAAGIEAAVLDGGLPAWLAAGLPTAEVSETTGAVGDVVVNWRAGSFVDADFTEKALNDPDFAVLDARGSDRFRGEVPEPRASVRRGHMPGAVSMPYAGLAPAGRMLPVTELEARFDETVGERRIVASCGSGVTAAVIALAAALTGREAAVYDGSWTEWGDSASGRPVVTG